MTRYQLWKSVSRNRMGFKGLCDRLWHFYVMDKVSAEVFDREQLRLDALKPSNAEDCPEWPYWWPTDAKGNAERRKACRILAGKPPAKKAVKGKQRASR